MAFKAVLFDFGGTLYDYACFGTAEAESLADLAAWSGLEASVVDVARAYRESMRQVFRAYLPRPFYFHHDLFREAAVGMLRALGAEARGDVLERYRRAQWQRHRRDFSLRPGVIETLTGLRQRGLHVGMVSNIDDDQLDHLLDAGGLRPHFDAILSSEQARSCKPDTRIYHQALASAGCAAAEALFVGDTLRQDVAGANQVGLQSVLLWHRPETPPALGDSPPRHVIRAIPDVLDLVDAAV